ncbi:putative peptide transport system ATP-binding protein [Firmicutes bacterium CAG:646]|nr:putative peptide transport system ATP-binding protein [Firmicutes bacterium CAG:646]
MGDKQNGSSFLFFQDIHQFQDLRLNRNVQSCSWLIGDQKLRLTCQRHGDHDTLTHTAGKLVRILFCHCFRIRNTNVAKHLHHFLFRLFLTHLLMNSERLAQLSLDCKNRVQTGHRLLKDNRNIISTNLTHIFQRYVCQILSVKSDRTAVNISVAVQKFQDTHGRHTLTAAAFSHDTQCLSGFYRIGDTVYRFHCTLFCLKKGMQIMNL